MVGSKSLLYTYPDVVPLIGKEQMLFIRIFLDDRSCFQVISIGGCSEILSETGSGIRLLLYNHLNICYIYLYISYINANFRYYKNEINSKNVTIMSHFQAK